MKLVKHARNTFSSLRIINQLYDCDKNNILFTLKDQGGGCFKKTAGEIMLNKKMIAALSANDVMTIAYVGGMEQANFNPYTD